MLTVTDYINKTNVQKSKAIYTVATIKRIPKITNS